MDLRERTWKAYVLSPYLASSFYFCVPDLKYFFSKLVKSSK